MATLKEELARAAPPGDTYLTVGVFDGVHLGHQHLIQVLQREASRAGCLAAAVTFRQHPRAVLEPSASVPWLTLPDERDRLLREAGVEVVVPISFTQQTSQVPAAEFVALLQRYLRMKGILVGPDFALGNERKGTPAFLKTLGEKQGFSVTVVDILETNGMRISSTVIREAVARGDVATTARMLGRNYTLEGEVIHGDRRGADMLGYPTANVALDPLVAVPANGIYATWAVLGRKRHRAATSIGVRPTFGGGARTIEAFLLDFSGDLYGKRLRLEFAHRLRDELSFESVDALKAQIELDVEKTRSLLPMP